MSRYKTRLGSWKESPDICMIELTNTCNFSCKMCSNKLMKRKKGHMTEDIFRKTLDRCIEAEIRIIKLYTTGESLLHPEFMSFWDIANTYPFKTIMISTNGSLLDELMIKEFVKSKKFHIQISFSGWDKRSYESRYIGGNFERIVKMIHFLVDEIKKAGLPRNTLKINSIIKDDDEMKKTKMFLITEFGLDDSQMYIHKANNWVDVILDDKKVTKKGIGKSEKNNEYRYYCHIANTRIGVLYDGKITACGCLDVNGELIIGDISKDSIKSIRQSEVFNEFLKEFNKGKVSDLICAKCDSLKRLG